jgi:hypothetical protein
MTKGDKSLITCLGTYSVKIRTLFYARFGPVAYG